MALTVSIDEIVESSRSPLLAIRPHWKRVRLGDIGSVLNGCAFKSSQFSRDAGIPLIRIRDVGGDSTDTNYAGDFDEQYLVDPGDLLVGMDGDFNCARWRGPRGLLNQRVCKLVVDDDLLNPRMLDYVLPGYLRAINEATSSITVKHLSSRTVESIPLPLPPRNEQDEIVAELDKQFSRLDEAVTNLRRAKANLKRYKAAVLKATTSGDWARVTFAEIAETASGGTPSRGNKNNFGGSIPWVKSGELRDGVVLECEERITEIGLANSSAKVFPKGTLCIAMYGATVGKLGVLGIDAATNQAVCAVFPGERVSRDFLKLYLSSVRDELIHLGQGGAQPNISQRIIRNLQVPIPSRDEQDRIVAEVERRFSLIAGVESLVESSLARASATRSAILQQAFAG